MTKKKKAATEKRIEIPPMNIREIEIVLVGDSPLVVHAWSEKAKAMMLAKQQKKARQAKEVRDPMQEYADSLYWMSKRPANLTLSAIAKGKFGFPCIGFKAAAVSACRYVDGVPMTVARGAFHVQGELVQIAGKPNPREDMVRIGMGVADLRYRPEFTTWRVTLTVTYNANVVSPEQIVNLFETAGFAVGVGEHRPERNGQWGRFHVAKDGE